MERELVADRGWLTKEQMREAIAICQSLPGPLAIQVGVYISYLRCGFWGAWAGGWAFILPNFVIVAALGALYVHLGDLQPVTAIFYGVSPAVIALILHSCYRLAAPLLAKYRENPNVQGFVKGAYAAAIGTILGACILLGRIAIGDWLTALIGLGSLAILFRWKVNNPLLIAATAVVGLVAFPLLEPTWVMLK
jgi:chromate transport protein ChrA